MTEHSKIAASHLARQAIVYLRQSSPVRSSTIANQRTGSMLWQSRLANSAGPTTGSLSSTRILAFLVPALSSAQGLHVSQLRWRLAMLASCSALKYPASHAIMPTGIASSILPAISDTLIGDADGIYHPGLFNDRLLLGLKGTMSEAELHVLRARLNGGIRNKAARGELRRGSASRLCLG